MNDDKPTPITPEEAITRLCAIGLYCEQVPGSPLHFLGGLIRIPGKIRGYQKAFTIFEDQDSSRFIAMVAEDRPYHDEEVTVDTLLDAVDAVIAIYRQREN